MATFFSQIAPLRQIETSRSKIAVQMQIFAGLLLHNSTNSRIGFANGLMEQRTFHQYSQASIMDASALNEPLAVLASQA